MFSVCSPEGGGGYPSQVPSPFPRLWSQVLSGRVSQSLFPCPFQGPARAMEWGTSRTGVSPSRTGVPSGQDWGTPLPPARTRVSPQPGLGFPPGKDWGTPPSPGQVMLQVVCLMRFAAEGLFVNNFKLS